MKLTWTRDETNENLYTAEGAVNSYAVVWQGNHWHAFKMRQPKGQIIRAAMLLTQHGAMARAQRWEDHG